MDLVSPVCATLRNWARSSVCAMLGVIANQGAHALADDTIIYTTSSHMPEKHFHVPARGLIAIGVLAC